MSWEQEGIGFRSRMGWYVLLNIRGHEQLGNLAILTSDFSVVNVDISCPVNLQVNYNSE